jgi:hypothetical protein
MEIIHTTNTSSTASSRNKHQRVPGPNDVCEWVGMHEGGGCAFVSVRVGKCGCGRVWVWANVGMGECGHGRMWAWANVGECVYMGGVYRYDTSGLLCVAWTEGRWRQGWVVHNTNTNTNNSIISVSATDAQVVCVRVQRASNRVLGRVLDWRSNILVASVANNADVPAFVPVCVCVCVCVCLCLRLCLCVCAADCRWNDPTTKPITARCLGVPVRVARTDPDKSASG